MQTQSELYKKYKDETGEEYYCPVAVIRDDQTVSEGKLDNCVEASTAGRYSGNLNVVDRFKF